MIYRLGMASDRASNVDHSPYIKWGFQVQTQKCIGIGGREYERQRFVPCIIDVEIDTLEKLQELIEDFESIVIDNNSITIYNDYME